MWSFLLSVLLVSFVNAKSWGWDKNPEGLDPVALFMQEFAQVVADVCPSDEGSVAECVRNNIHTMEKFYEKCQDEYEEIHLCVIGHLIHTGSKLAKMPIHRFWTLVTHYTHLQASFMRPLEDMTNMVLVAAVQECNAQPMKMYEEFEKCLMMKVREYIQRHEDYFDNFFMPEKDVSINIKEGGF